MDNAEKLSFICWAGQRAGKTYAPAYTVHVLDKMYSGSRMVDIPPVLLNMTRQVLMLACSAQETTKIGTFASAIKQDTSVEAPAKARGGCSASGHALQVCGTISACR